MESIFFTSRAIGAGSVRGVPMIMRTCKLWQYEVYWGFNRNHYIVERLKIIFIRYYRTLLRWEVLWEQASIQHES